MEEKLKLLWLILIFVDFGLMFVSFPILIEISPVLRNLITVIFYY